MALPLLINNRIRDFIIHHLCNLRNLLFQMFLWVVGAKHLLA